LLVRLGVCLLLLMGIVGSPDQQGVAQTPGVLFGSSAGQRGNESPREAVERLEAAIGRQLAVVRVFKRWDAAFPTDYERWLRQSGHAIFLSAAAQRLDGGNIPWSSIANAQPGSALYEDIVSWADRIGAYGAPVFFAFDAEPETGPSSMGDPGDFVDAWRRIVSVFRDRGVTNARFVMTLTAFTYGRTDARGAAEWYPGDDWVDAIGADGYNFFGCSPGVNDTWRDFAQVFEPVRQFGFQHPSEPILIAEYGSVEDPSTPGRKAEWITGARATLQSSGWEQFDAALYWHSQTTGCPFWVDTSQASVDAFAAMGADPYFFAGAPPVIASIDPPQGRVGTTVTIRGSNLTGVQSVTFDGASAAFSTTSPTSVTATVPAGATAGPIEVVTQFGSAPGPAFAVIHDRNVTLSLQEDPAVVSGRIGVEDGFDGCLSDRIVKVQRRIGDSRWRTILTKVSRDDGTYRARLVDDRRGKLRVRLIRETLQAGDICSRARSGVRHL
jgi:hypothetical protein